MKINEILTEDLGNLHQLKVGPMINLLKQNTRGNAEIDKKFNSGYTSGWNGGIVGPDSEVVDMGALKGGISGIRKAFRATEDKGPLGFAVYLNGKAVIFCMTGDYQLAGSSRSMAVAYDLTGYEAEVKAISHYGSGITGPTSVRTITGTDWDYKSGSSIDVIRNYAGTEMQTGELKNLLGVIDEIGKKEGVPVTFKMVFKDVKAGERKKERQDRISREQLKTGVEELKVRLAKFKLSKKPTVNTIQEFIQQIFKNPGKVIQFSGRSFKLLHEEGYQKTAQSAILTGKPFTIHYKCVDPGAYDSMEIQYVFDSSTMSIKPTVAKWSDSTRKFHEEYVDPHAYAKTLNNGLRDLNNKESVIKTILTFIKADQIADAEKAVKLVRTAGNTWPELDIIEKSIAAAKTKPQ